MTFAFSSNGPISLSSGITWIGQTTPAPKPKLILIRGGKVKRAAGPEEKK